MAQTNLSLRLAPLRKFAEKVPERPAVTLHSRVERVQVAPKRLVVFRFRIGFHLADSIDNAVRLKSRNPTSQSVQGTASPITITRQNCGDNFLPQHFSILQRGNQYFGAHFLVATHHLQKRGPGRKADAVIWIAFFPICHEAE